MVKISLKKERLESLDILRGIDLFFLVGLEGVMHAVDTAVDAGWFDSVMWYFTHVEWSGFSTWDLVMPLFMFMTGVAIPFSLSKYKRQHVDTHVMFRIMRRVIVLWVFGMMCQGNLLALDPSRVYLYSNTLQAIAAGYLVASMLYLFVGLRTMILVGFALMLVYWGGMEFISVDSFGAGNYSSGYNFAEWVDRVCLGRFRDMASVVDGKVIFAEHYHYTWIWSTLTFSVTVISGVVAGVILRQTSVTPLRKVVLLIFGGGLMVVVGWMLHPYHPVIKRIWTVSMVLVSSGYCWLLMALFYFVVDYCRWRRWLLWLKVYGMNSIAAYMLASCVDFGCLSRSLLFGVEQYVGEFYPVIIASINAVVIYVILWMMYMRSVFLKV